MKTRRLSEGWYQPKSHEKTIKNLLEMADPYFLLHVDASDLAKALIWELKFFGLIPLYDMNSLEKYILRNSLKILSWAHLIGLKRSATSSEIF